MLAENLKKWRKKRGYKPYELAVKAGVSPTYIYYLESEKRALSVYIAFKLADALDISIEELVFGSENKSIIKKQLNQK